MHSPKTEMREPLRKILVATDFSPGAQLAFERALLLPMAGNATVHVVHVLSPNVPAKARGKATSEAKQRLEKCLSSARAQADAKKLSITMEILSGEPFVEIIRCSRNVNAELVVLGRHGHRPVQDMFIGTTAERVIRKGDVPILAVHLNPASPYRRPLIATDLGDTAPRVFGLTLRMLEPTVKAIHVVHAFNVPFEGFVTPTLGTKEKSDYRRSFRDSAKAGMAKLLARYENTGLRWRSTIRAGDARSLILEEILRRRADLVALGTHGRSGIAHALVGSVAEWVIAQAPCDVLVARPVRFSFELP